MLFKDIITYSHYFSPCGELTLGSFWGKLCLCDWTNGWHSEQTLDRVKRLLCADFVEGRSDVTEKAAHQLNEYFSGERNTFDVPPLFVGTDFQKLVWNELLKIPFGTTISYGELASQIGAPRSVRAVANANGANAISIFAPCHRIVGSNNTLGGYGGGLDAKQFLLKLEQND